MNLNSDNKSLMNLSSFLNLNCNNLKNCCYCIQSNKDEEIKFFNKISF